MNLLKPANARSVEPDPFFEHVLGELLGRNGEVLPKARQVDEPQVDSLNPFILDEIHYVFCVHPVPPKLCVVKNMVCASQTH